MPSPKDNPSHSLSVFQKAKDWVRVLLKGLHAVRVWIVRSGKTPTIIQMEMAECGAAALSIILAYWGKHISLEEAREACGVSRDGSKALNMLLAARQYGLKAQGAQTDDIDELQDLKDPFIAFWEFNHFVVVERVTDDKVYINDPAMGPRILTREEFSRAFTGVLLLFEPTAKFKEGGRPASAIAALKQRLGTSRIALIFVICTTFLSAIPGFITPGFAKIFIDDILIGDMEEWFVPLMVAISGATLMGAVLIWVQQTHLMRLHLKVMVTNSAKFLWHVFHLPMAFFSQRYAGDIQARMAANGRIADLVSGQLSSSVISLITLVLYVVVMALLTVKLTILVVVSGIFNMTLLYLIAEKISSMNHRMLQQQGKLSGLSMNGLHIMETLKATGREDSFFLSWVGLHTKSINSQQKIMLYNQILMLVPSLVSGLTGVTVLGWGALEIMGGHMTIGTLLAFQMLSAAFQAPLGTLLGMAGSIQQIRGDLLRLDDVLQHPEDARLVKTTLAPTLDKKKKLDGKVTLKNISFGYSRLEPAFISNFDLEMSPGQRIAVVGATGSGKSTVAKLIAGLYTPWEGELLFDDQRIDKVPRSVLSNSLALVDQDIFLYEGSIRNNLTFWDRRIPEADIYRALKDACIEEDVFTHGGLDSEMAENGANFSGGQRQRLEIARSLILSPSILLLDEATSSLDTLTEEQIYKNLKARGCTLLIIAHRVSTIKDCDHILVLSKGNLVEKGTHDELMQQDGAYKQLMNLELVS